MAVAVAVPESPRWRGPQVPRVAALLLLPVPPVAVELLDVDDGSAQQWQRALHWFDLPVGRVTGPGGVALAMSPAAAVASGAQNVLLDGEDERGVLEAAGYSTCVWTARSAPAGAVALVTGDTGMRLDPPAPTRGGPRLRAAAVAAVHRTRGLARLTVASRLAGPPALAALRGCPRACVVSGGGGPRRRAVLLMGREDVSRAEQVVKVGRSADASRAQREQAVLRNLQELDVGRRVPLPLGHGRLGSLTWSAETALQGTPLADVLGQRGSVSQVLALLENVSTWLGELASATRTAVLPALDPSVLPLLGEHRRLVPAIDELVGVPGVLAHGDLAAGFNLLVDGASWGVLDWETARQQAPPLVDLLPLVSAALSSLHAPPGHVAQARYVLRLCAGHERSSAWFLRLVGKYLRAVQVPVDKAGVLAGLAFGYQASMRLAHEQLVRAAGDDPLTWESMWDDVARGWASTPSLGSEWSALHHALQS